MTMSPVLSDNESERTSKRCENRALGPISRRLVLSEWSRGWNCSPVTTLYSVSIPDHGAHWAWFRPSGRVQTEQLIPDRESRLVARRFPVQGPVCPEAAFKPSQESHSIKLPVNTQSTGIEPRRTVPFLAVGLKEKKRPSRQPAHFNPLIAKSLAISISNSFPSCGYSGGIGPSLTLRSSLRRNATSTGWTISRSRASAVNSESWKWKKASPSTLPVT